MEIASAYVSLIPQLTKGAGNRIGKQLDSSDVRNAAGKSGRSIGGTMGKGLALGLAAGAAALGAIAVKTTKDMLRVERLGAQTNAVIEATGGAAGRSRVQVDALAENLERMTGAEQETVTEGQNMLLTFKNIEGKQFDEATKAMLDMGVAMNKGSLNGLDLKATSIQMGKALNDPIKGISALSKVGVSFTAQQKEQIKAMQESGDIAGAQGVILDELKGEFGGAAEAAGNTTEGMAAKIQNAFGNIAEKTMSAVLPMLQTLMEWVNKKVMPALTRFGDWLKNDGADRLKVFGGWLKDNVLPPLKDFAEFLGDAAKWIGENRDVVVPLAVALGTFVGVLGAAAGIIKVVTAATAIWNAVLAINPIVLIVAGVIALIAGLIWFFTQTEVGKKAWKAFTDFLTATMDNIVGFFEAAWGWIQDAIANVWGWIKNNWPLLLAIITGPIGAAVILVIRNWGKIKAATKKVWDAIKSTITTVWTAIWEFLKKIWGFIKEKVFDRIALGLLILREAFKIGRDKITGFFTGIWEGLKKTWGFIKANVFDKVALGLVILREAFKLGRDKITGFFSDIWESIKLVWTSIRDKVFAKFKGGLAALKEAFGAAKDGIKTIWNRLKKIAADPVNFVIKWVYNKGIVPLVGSVFSFLKKENPLKEIAPIEFARGGWTGPGARLTPAGIVHADEFVINKGARRRIERDAPGALDYMNTTGRLPGYAGGGSVATLSDGAKWWQNLGARVSEFSAWGQPVGRHMPGSLHYSGRAADLNYGPPGESATEKAFFDRYMGQFRSLFPDLGVLWRVAGHFNHAHIDTGGTAAVGGAGLGGFNPLTVVNDLRALVDTMKNGLADNPFGRMLLDVGGRLVNGPIGWLQDRFGNIVEGAGELAGKVVGAARDAGTQATVRALAMTYGSGLSRWGFGKQWDALNWIINTESGWDPNAANPTSSARGLFQKMTSVHGPIESSVFGQAKWGLDYIRGRYGDPIAAQAFHRAHGYYADGGRVTPMLYDSGGWLPAGGIGVNRTGKPEAVLTPEESDALRAGLNRRPVELHFYGQRTPTVRDVVHALNVADLHDVGVTA